MYYVMSLLKLTSHARPNCVGHAHTQQHFHRADEHRTKVVLVIINTTEYNIGFITTKIQKYKALR